MAAGSVFASFAEHFCGALIAGIPYVGKIFTSRLAPPVMSSIAPRKGHIPYENVSKRKAVGSSKVNTSALSKSKTALGIPFYFLFSNFA